MYAPSCNRVYSFIVSSDHLSQVGSDPSIQTRYCTWSAVPYSCAAKSKRNVFSLYATVKGCSSWTTPLYKRESFMLVLMELIRTVGFVAGRFWLRASIRPMPRRFPNHMVPSGSSNNVNGFTVPIRGETVWSRRINPSSLWCCNTCMLSLYHNPGITTTFFSYIKERSLTDSWVSCKRRNV